MISDEKRRLAAARLRALADANEGRLGTPRMALVLREGQEILGTVGLASVADVLRRHAELIDRPTCRNESGYGDIFLCSECAARIELIAEEGNEYGDMFHTPFQPRYCPNCGAYVRSGDE